MAEADLQWLRAKAADTFGPMGPALVTNVDYNKLKLIGRLNGKVVQETTTRLLIFSIDNIVSYTSRYITLEPGDVIFTGTPGTTQAMKPGDTFEVEIAGRRCPSQQGCRREPGNPLRTVIAAPAAMPSRATSALRATVAKGQPLAHRSSRVWLASEGGGEASASLEKK